MAASLRPFARSRGLFALGLVAWWMLVFSSLVAAPLGVESAHAHCMHGATAAVGEPTHHGLTHTASHDCCAQHDDCRGNASGHACGCVGMCASALPPEPGGMLMTAWVTAAYAGPTRLHAPSAPATPPLRPPSV